MVHLHVHSMYSLRDSIIKPKDLAARLIEIGQDSIAITDHGGSLGGINIYKLLKKNNIKYIHGCEFYICDDTSIKDKNNRYYHLIALCKNDIGRINLNKLISISEHPDNKYYRPRIDFEKLRQHSDGLIILSACLAGEVSKYISEAQYDKAKEIALKYKSVFNGDYYLEIQARNDSEQIEANKQILNLSTELNIDCVVTSDAHYINKEDAKYQSKYAFYGAYKEGDEGYIDCYIQSEDEVRGNLNYFEIDFIDKLIKNNHAVSEKCNLEMPLSAPIMPHIDTPAEFSSNTEWLSDLCIRGLKEKLNIDYHKKDIHDKSRWLYSNNYDDNGNFIEAAKYQLSKSEIEEYIKRYEYELDSLDRMGFIDYILLVYSYANMAKRKGIARGSGGGSLICYVTNITNIDPIEHGLYFERFIDVGALDLLASGDITVNELKIPDIDLDFSSESCGEVLRFLYNKYGENNVASIGKFGNNLTKGTIRDMCKVFDIELTIADKISKSFESYEIEEIDSMINGSIDISNSAKEAIEYILDYKELFEYVRKLNGLPKSFGLHACGKIISTKELDSFLPSCYDSEGIRYLQGDMHDVEDVGLVKIDVLGLRTIDHEYDSLQIANQDIEFINPKQKYNDPKVLEVFKNGDTVGIFQFSSFGMKQTLKKMNVSGIDDLSIANALFRPGAMAYIDNFCNRRSGAEKFEYLHEDLKPILENTYGIIVFQEQLIEIGRMAGIRNPDLLRKATGKKDIELLNQVKPELEEKLCKKGWTAEQFNRLWLDMIDFARYSFNKSHSSAYAIIAYMTAKLKVYYPVEYYAGLCNSYIGKSNYVKEKVSEISEDIITHKISFIPLSFKNDHRRCSVKDGKLVYAIPLIKDCSSALAAELYQIRNNKYDSFIDLLYGLMQTCCDSKQLSILIKLDFFKDFGNSKYLMELRDVFDLFKKGKKDSVIQMAKQISKEKIKDPVIKSIIERHSRATEKTYLDLDVKNILIEIEQYLSTQDIEDYSFKEKVAIQQEHLGFINIQTNEEKDKNQLLAVSVLPIKTKDKSRVWGYKIKTISIASGKNAEITVYSKVFNRNPIQDLDILFLKKEWLEKKEYNGYTNWYARQYKIVN